MLHAPSLKCTQIVKMYIKIEKTDLHQKTEGDSMSVKSDFFPPFKRIPAHSPGC